MYGAVALKAMLRKQLRSILTNDHALMIQHNMLHMSHGLCVSQLKNLINLVGNSLCHPQNVHICGPTLMTMTWIMWYVFHHSENIFLAFLDLQRGFPAPVYSQHLCVLLREC